MNVMVTGISASRGKTESVIAAKTAVTTSEAANSRRGPVTAFYSTRVGDFATIQNQAMEIDFVR
jgi:hypothetical protein